MLEKLMNAIESAYKHDLGNGSVSTEHLMLMVNEIKTLREVNTNLKLESKDFQSEIETLKERNQLIIDRLQIALDGAEMYAKHAEEAKRKFRMGTAPDKCQDILKVYG